MAAKKRRTTKKKPPRPLGVSCLGCFFFFASLVGGAILVSILLYRNGFLEWPLKEKPPAEIHQIGLPELALATTLAFVHLPIAIGLFKGQNWARIVTMLLSVCWIGNAAYQFANNRTANSGSPVIVDIVILIYLCLPNVRRYFGA